MPTPLPRSDAIRALAKLPVTPHAPRASLPMTALRTQKRKSEKGAPKPKRLSGAAVTAAFHLCVDKRDRLADGLIYSHIAGV